MSDVTKTRSWRDAICVVAGILVATSACASGGHQFSGTIAWRNLAPQTVSVYGLRGLDRTGPSVLDLRQGGTSVVLLGPMPAPDTLWLRWAYGTKWGDGGDPNAVEQMVLVPPLPAGGELPDMRIAFAAEGRWAVTWVRQ